MGTLVVSLRQGEPLTFHLSVPRYAESSDEGPEQGLSELGFSCGASDGWSWSKGTQKRWEGCGNNLCFCMFITFGILLKIQNAKSDICFSARYL